MNTDTNDSDDWDSWHGILCQNSNVTFMQKKGIT